MIILDAEEQERSKQFHDPYYGGPTLRFPEKAAARSDSPLPDYETSEARQKLIAKQAAPRKHIDSKFWRAVLYALGIYALLSVVIAVPIAVLKKRQSAVAPTNYGPSWDSDPDTGGSISATTDLWEIANAAECEWGQFEPTDTPGFTAHVEHSLNYSGSFYIRSNISDGSPYSIYSNGNFTVDINPDNSTSRIVFTVDVQATSDDLLRHTSACFVNSGTNRGLFLYVTRPLAGNDFLDVNIQMLLPSTVNSVSLDNFVTSLPWFSHVFGNLKNYLTIKNLVIEGAGFDVVAGSIKASTISVKNSYGSIIGDYYATSSLTLDGIKGNIDSNITLEQLSSSTGPTSLILDTGDGSIEARVTLIAPSSARSHNLPPFMFVAAVSTFNGPLTFQADYTNSTPPTPLQLTVSNTDGNTNVTLDKSYEGTINVQSKLGSVVVRKPYVSAALDPLGKFRQHSYVTQQVDAHQITGWTGWGKQPTYGGGVVQGQVKVTTSLSPITLQLSAS